MDMARSEEGENSVRWRIQGKSLRVSTVLLGLAQPGNWHLETWPEFSWGEAARGQEGEKAEDRADKGRLVGVGR